MRGMEQPSFFSLLDINIPTLWKLIVTLRAEVAQVSAQILQLERGIRPKKRTKRVHRQLQEHLFNICQDYRLGRKTIPELLMAVSNNLRGGQPNI